MLGPQDTHEEVVEQNPVEQTTLMKEHTPDDIDRIFLARALNMDKLDDIKDHERRLDKILLWAKEKGANTEVDLMAEINGLRNRLGNPNIYAISVYVGLEMQKIALEKEEREVADKMQKFHG